jgi:hypothetical protein
MNQKARSYVHVASGKSLCTLQGRLTLASGVVVLALMAETLAVRRMAAAVAASSSLPLSR